MAARVDAVALAPSFPGAPPCSHMPPSRALPLTPAPAAPPSSSGGGGGAISGSDALASLLAFAAACAGAPGGNGGNHSGRDQACPTRAGRHEVCFRRRSNSSGGYGGNGSGTGVNGSSAGFEGSGVAVDLRPPPPSPVAFLKVHRHCDTPRVPAVTRLECLR